MLCYHHYMTQFLVSLLRRDLTLSIYYFQKLNYVIFLYEMRPFISDSSPFFRPRIYKLLTLQPNIKSYNHCGNWRWIWCWAVMSSKLDVKILDFMLHIYFRCQRICPPCKSTKSNIHSQRDLHGRVYYSTGNWIIHELSCKFSNLIII